MALLKLTGGRIFDPANDVNDVVGDIWIEDGVVIAPPASEDSVHEIDVNGMVVMPGGVDMHCHIVGPKVNTARKMQPEQYRAEFDGRSQFGATVPDIITTGQKYMALGYTTCFDAAVTPTAARFVHHEIDDLPNVDAGFYVLVGNNHYIMNCAAENDQAGVQAFLGWLINRTGAYAPKIVNPGGVELFKQRQSGNATDLDQVIDGFNTTPRRIIQTVTTAANQMGLPHPVHIHCNNLGIPGNWQTTLETMKSVQGSRAHLTHIQFQSYGGGTDDELTLCSKVEMLADYVNSNPQISVDVGQVVFGPATSMTADGPLAYFLQQLSGEKWYSADTEVESGCGISPFEYKDKNFVHGLQWAIGLEWYLQVRDPWQVVMSTDHPNGGSFLAYPQIIRLLMDRSYREELLGRVNKRVLKHSNLLDMSREYSLYEIAIITRAGPARLLGLKNKGHMGPGADADITVYSPSENYEEMFSVPRWVIKGGQIAVNDYEVKNNVSSGAILAAPAYDRHRDAEIENWFDRHYSFSSRNFGFSKPS